MNALAGLGAEIEPVGEEEPLGRGGGLRLRGLARGGSAGRCSRSTATSCSTSTSRRSLAEHERERRRGDDRRRAGPLRRSASSRSRRTARITGFREAPQLEHWVNSGVYVLGDEALARLPERGDHEQSTFPELAGEGRLRGAPPRRRLADREHAEGPPPRRRVHGGAPRLAAAARQDRVSLDSPNYGALDRFVVRAAPGREAVGLGADLGARRAYVGKVLFVRAGQSLSLQFHREKDESWYVQSGRARARARRGGQGALDEEVVGEGACFRFRPGTVHRVTALEDTTILEVSTPHLDDVVRLEDAYGRAGTQRTLTHLC